MTPVRCPKCGSNAVSDFIRPLESFEEEHHWRCFDCRHDWYTYSDMSEPEEIRDMRLYIEM
jgi:formate dehydrogenase maturation protein FdhE